MQLRADLMFVKKLLRKVVWRVRFIHLSVYSH